MEVTTNQTPRAFYGEQLRTPKWQRRRLEELQRADFKCEVCGTDRVELQIHHLKYEHGHPADVPPGYLEVLCADCHSWREAWNMLFGRTLIATAHCKCMVGTGLRALVNAPKPTRSKFDDGEFYSEVLTNLLALLIDGSAPETADRIAERHLAKLVDSRRAESRATSFAAFPLLRYDVANGETLCVDCHKEAHRER